MLERLKINSYEELVGKRVYCKSLPKKLCKVIYYNTEFNTYTLVNTLGVTQRVKPENLYPEAGATLICTNCKEYLDIHEEVCDCGCSTLELTDNKNHKFIKKKSVNVDLITKDLSKSLHEVQKHIRGYVYNRHTNSIEVALDENTTLRVSTSLALQTTHMYSDSNIFIPFPDNKSLFDMKKEPTDFHSWYQENVDKLIRK